MEAFTADIRAPASHSAELSQKEGNKTTTVSPAQTGSSVGEGETKIEERREVVEIFIVKDGNNAEEIMENKNDKVLEANSSSEDENNDVADDVVMFNVMW